MLILPIMLSCSSFQSDGQNNCDPVIKIMIQNDGKNNIAHLLICGKIIRPKAGSIPACGHRPRERWLIPHISFIILDSIFGGKSPEFFLIDTFSMMLFLIVDIMA